MKERRALLGEQIRLRPAWIDCMAQNEEVHYVKLARLQTEKVVGVVVGYDPEIPEIVHARFGDVTITAGGDLYDCVRSVETWEVVPR